MSLIIDGHNLIGALPDIRLGDPDDEAQLLARLRGYRAATGQALIVFFDSGDLPARFPDPSSPGLQVRFAGPGQTADDAIVAYLDSRREPGQYAVVTNDHALTDRVRLAGASTIPASDFAARLARRPHHATPSSPHAQARTQAPGPGPDPRDPAFADIYARFLAVDKEANDAGRADLAAWIEILYGDDAEQAQVATDWLGRHGGPPALAALRDALTHDAPQVRAAAALALAAAGDANAAPNLIDRLAHDAASLVRQAAAQSLGFLGSRQAEPALEAAAASDSKRRVRKAARIALAQIKARHP